MDITYNHGDDNHFHGISWKYNVLTNKNMKRYNVDIMVIYLIYVNGQFFSGNAPEHPSWQENPNRRNCWNIIRKII